MFFLDILFLKDTLSALLWHFDFLVRGSMAKLKNLLKQSIDATF